jgi:valyl-tRNA synthetase
MWLQALDQLQFQRGGQAIYDFVWNDFAARYVEAVKPISAKGDSPTAGRWPPSIT